ncbi:MAG TPA: DUF2188 domain-containing protein [Shinella sp.]|uniref:DUF2188 domain-containing protein n=1 Tax=Shinella sp. TaxID=1870904 RepID=UPI002E120CA8|nr:DUF2188 domain-containing protein [Shinella sp.]
MEESKKIAIFNFGFSWRFCMSRKSQHVVPSSGKWSVRQAGSSRASHTFSTQGEAIKVAKEIARNQGAELYIHGANGRIRDRVSYGNDPRSSKG